MKISSLYSKIRKVVEKSPDKIAVEYGNEKITYLQLEGISNQIANFLDTNINTEKNVPVLMDRCPELVEAVLGILKAGDLFVPLDVNIPDNRLMTMIEDVHPDWIISQYRWLQKLDRIFVDSGKRVNVLVMDPVNIQSEEFKSIDVFTIDNNISQEYPYPDEIINKHCYIYFTTGSTGRPKAVLGRHLSLSHFIEWEIEQFGVDESFRVSQLIAPSFGPFKRDIFVPLCAGATLCIPEKSNLILDSDTFYEWVDKNHISLIHIVPSLFKVLSAGLKDENGLSSLKYILFCGEALRGNDIRKFLSIFKSKIQLAVLYGQTESTLAKMFYYIKESDADRAVIPVGKPIKGVEVLLLDEDLKKCPLGGVGEICIRSPFISSGYYNDKELTKKVFIRNPFNDNPSDIIYRTGDIAKMLPDGNIEIIGRRDYQVKIRGMKVQIKGIENQLLSYPAIKDVVIIDKDDVEGSKFLCAYIISENEITVSELKEYLSKELPDYMIPSYFIRLDKLPLLPNGKVDRKLLPELKLKSYTGVEYVEPCGDVEIKLAGIWKEILEVERIGVNDNFFEIGGHSLKATRLVSQIHKVFNKEILLGEVFKRKTIKELAGFIKGMDDSSMYSSIEPIDNAGYEDKCYPVSSAQKRIFILNQLDKNNVAYNISQAVLLEGDINKEAFERAIKLLIRRHDALRTSFGFKGGEIVQKVHEEVAIPVSYLDKSREELDQESIAALLKGFVKPYDLADAPLFRSILIKISDDRYIILFDIHHIVSDETSIGILWRDFIDLYYGHELKDLRIQYKDFAIWQNKQLISEKFKKYEEYWLDLFKEGIPVLNLPADYVHPAIQSYEGDKIILSVGEALTEKLRELCGESETTLYMILLCAFNILLFRYTGQQEIVVGSPIAGRPHSDLENIVGMFVNTLAMKNNPQGNLTIKEFLYDIRENSLKAFENQSYQIDMLIDKLHIDRDLSRNPLFDVLFVLHNAGGKTSGGAGLEFTSIEFQNEISKFDLSLQAMETGKDITLGFEYYTRIFKKETIERMSKHFINILSEMVCNYNKTLYEIDMLTEEEKEQIFVQFNNSDTPYPYEKGIRHLFEEQVNRTPNNVALIFEGKQMTYDQLNRKANQAAWFLRGKGLLENSVVGVMAERSFELVISILGILKAGGAYLPIDTNYPAERIRYLLDHSSTSILLTNEKHTGKIDIGNAEVIAIDTLLYQNELPETNLDIPYSPESLMYILYTSGSTGNPKGVMIKNHSAVNLLTWFTDEYRIDANDKTLLIAPISFDLAQKNLYSTLIKGGSLCLYTPGLYDYKLMSDVIEKEGITLINCAPSAIYPLIDMNRSTDFSKLKSLRFVFLGGENINLNKLRDWIRSPNCNSDIANTYGPTECTDIAAAYTIDKSKIEELGVVPIGKPVYNTRLYILDEAKNILPLGVAGELYIGGTGVGKGYYNSIEATEERFVVCPNIEPGRIYRTGDLGKWLPDGNIEFIGRKDFQVKLRGLRIELGEIESQLLMHPLVKEAIVIAKENQNGDKYLVSYIVAEQEADVSEIREYLKKQIPEYMVPSFIIKMEKFPLSPNGKIDRESLPEPDRDMPANRYESPKNEVEERLASIWKEILAVEIVGVNDSFFDIGGNSLYLIQMFRKIDDIYPGKITVASLFSLTTISKLASYIMKGGSCNTKAIEAFSMAFPEEYFIDDTVRNDNMIFRYTLESPIVEVLMRISEGAGMDFCNILLAILVFLLSEVTKNDEVALQTMMGENCPVVPIRVNMEDVVDYPDLFQKVNRELEDCERNEYSLNHFGNFIPQKQKDTVKVFFCYGSMDRMIGDLLKVYDVVFAIEEREKSLDIVCEYDYIILKNEKIQELFSGYLKLLRLMLENYEESNR